ncbi:unnamed protein product, partial [Didymodactylos carnosus]
QVNETTKKIVAQRLLEHFQPYINEINTKTDYATIRNRIQMAYPNLKDKHAFEVTYTLSERLRQRRNRQAKVSSSNNSNDNKNMVLTVEPLQTLTVLA